MTGSADDPSLSLQAQGGGGDQMRRSQLRRNAFARAQGSLDVAAALSGTFLGVLLAYGFVGPIATGLDHRNAAELRFYHFIKASVVALAKGATPIVATEFARRSIWSADRPSFLEMESACKRLKMKAAA